MSKPPFAEIAFATAGVEAERRGDGDMILRSPYALDPYPASVPAMLHSQAEQTRDRVWLAERTEPAIVDSKWRKLTYGEGSGLLRHLGQAFLDRGASPERPVMLLSDNAIDNALVQLAAMQAGVPAAPVSPAYSLMSQDYGKLKYIYDLLTPGIVYAGDGKTFGPALEALPLGDTPVVVSANPGNSGHELIDELRQTEPGSGIDQAFASVDGGTIAKILFTSGSTGPPKGVINLHSMMCSNVVAQGQLWRFLDQRPPVMVDWLPWSHTFGGNHNFNLTILKGGTLYIDAGKPAPGLIERTVQNLREISPTCYLNVPRGFDVLIPYLQRDSALRDNFFAELDMVIYAGAMLPPNLWAALEALSIEARGERIVMLSSWGSTETAPAASSVHWPIEKAGVIGVPLPGTEIKLAQSGTKMEMRVKGANVTPGYWRSPELSREAFDEEGFLRMGDAGKLEDPDDPKKGLVFDGRTAENFKLTSGTWVHAGELRLMAISAGAPVIQDAVLTGHDREELGLLVFPNPDGCRSLVGESDDAGLPELVKREEVRAALKKGLAKYNEANPASSRRIARALILTALPNIDANEITDKGYINQRAVLENRADMVAKIYADSDSDVLVIP
ncbi:MAG: feruloyl-CoA synthase [Alphaproteobacteria bacterium]|nr:feruloyl-CoA synthase [Alphaproteobacteria bacterium]